jgi:hypothetical protein
VDWVIEEIIGIRNKAKLFARVRAGHYGFRTLNAEAINLAIFNNISTNARYLHNWTKPVSHHT